MVMVLAEDYEPEPKTSAGYIENGQMWLDLAEWEVLENASPDSAVPLAMLAMASALLGICAQFIQRPIDQGQPSPMEG